MKHVSKKWVAMLLVMMMTVALFSGCGTDKASDDEGTQQSDNGGGADTTDSSDNNTDTNDSDDSAYPDHSAGFEDTVTINIPVYERGWEGWNPTDSYWTGWIQENFGDKYNINVEFTPIGRSTEVVDFKQLLAAGTAPDIIFHYDYPNILDYYSEGAFQTLDTDEIANYAPTFWSDMGDVIKEYGVIDGEQKVVMGDRAELVSKNYLTMIRKDWVDQVGMELPTSLEEYNELLEAWKEAGLGYASATLMTKSFNFDYAFRDWPIDEEGRALNSDLAVAALSWEPTRDFLKSMNHQWNEDYISKEFYLDTDGTKAKADFISGKAGTWGTYVYSTTIADIENLLANQPGAELAVLDAKAGVPEGNQPQGREYWPFGMIFGINVNTSDEVRQAIWMYLEWMNQPDVLYTLQNGFEGTHYELDENGLPVSLGYTGEQRLSNNDNADYWCLVNANKVYGSDELNNLAAVNSYGPSGYEYLIQETIDANEAYSEYRTPDTAFTVPIETVSEYSGDLSSLFQELYVKLVTSPEDEFDALYEEAKQEYLDAGYQEILDEKQAAYDAGLYH